jgi:hypothetical protein
MSRAARCSALLFAGVLGLGCARGDETPGGAGAFSATSSASAGSGGAGQGGAGQGGEGGAPSEPDGPPKLTVVNGVNDYDAIRLCFVPWPDGGDPAPIPADPAGLPFAHAVVIDPQGGALPAGTDVYVHVLSGDLSQTAGKGCAALVAGAGGPDVVVAPVAVIPGAAIAAPRSLLLVPNGCLGGPGHTGNTEKQACGSTYSASTPNPGLVAVGLSRLTTKGKVALSVVHASAAMATVDVRLLGGYEGAMPVPLATSLSAGAVAPFPPLSALGLVELGTLDKVAVQTFPAGGPMPSSTVALKEVFSQSPVAAADMADGQGYALVAVGAQPGLAAGAFWHALTYTLVRVDP